MTIVGMKKILLKLIECDWKRILYFIEAVVFSSIVSWHCQAFIRGNDAAINIIVTFFSILAGIQIGVITFMVDPSHLPPGDWRVAELARDTVLARLARQKWLFWLYLLSPALMVISVVVAKVDPSAASIFDRAFLFFSTLAFVLSLALPSYLLDLQQERIDQEIERRRLEAGISPPSHQGEG